MEYKHTQFGTLIFVFVIAFEALLAYIYWYSGYLLIILYILLFILFMLVSFITLTVKIDQEFVRIRFGYGIFRTKYRLKDIASVRKVRNHWYYGWGIRYWFWPHMWIFNVSGLDAVEIKLKNGKIRRIGTDEPVKLEKALKAAIKN